MVNGYRILVIHCCLCFNIAIGIMGVHHYPIDSVTELMKLVMAGFVLNPQGDEHETRQPDRKAEQVDYGKGLMLDEVAEGDLKEIS